MSGTGENENDLRKILDMTRYASIVLLLLHFYFYCYGFFRSLSWRSSLIDSILNNLVRTGLFNHAINSKLIAAALLAIALFGARGKKDEKLQVKAIVWMLLLGVSLYLGSGLILKLSADIKVLAISYILVTSCGYLLILAGGNLLSRLIQMQFSKDVFNEDNETFPQEERRLQNEYSVNFTSRYNLNGKKRNSHINIINPFRGTIVCGTPGSGKSWFVILPLIRQMIAKGYGMFIYDFKFDDLSKPAYNWMLQYKSNYNSPPSFYSINFDNLEYSHRCNPLFPSAMTDITDATEAARSLIFGLNKSAVKKQGDFFIESAINLLTAVIWYLKNYGNGEYCTLPHVIELIQVAYEDLFPVLNTQPEVHAHINDFIQSFEADVMDQLSGQAASLKVVIARIASPKLYWVLSGNDFTLDINDPEKPKIVCIGNNPQKQEAYSAPLSLFVSRLIRIVNQKGKQKCALVFDEFPTIQVQKVDALIATARSNKVATVLGMQDISQLKEDYGKDRADVLVNVCGSIISGQVMGEMAKTLADRFGKIVQTRQSFSINRNDTSVSRSTQLDYAIPASKIASLSSGEFVGMVADDPDNKIKLKMFHAEIVQDSAALNEEMKQFREIPKVREVSSQQVSDNYYQVKLDIQNLVEQEMYKIKLQEEDADAFTEHGFG